MNKREPKHYTVAEAEKLKALGKLPENAILQVTEEDLGYTWLSPEAEPDTWPADVRAALESSWEACREIYDQQVADPIGFWAYGMTPERLARSPRVLEQLCREQGAGERFDKLKRAKEPITKIRRGALAWNQFLIRMDSPPHFPGFAWFSDENTASLLTELLGFDVSTSDVENDRRSLKIKKLPAKYLFPPKRLRLAITALRKSRHQGS